jgi:hypothetical protein
MPALAVLRRDVVISYDGADDDLARPLPSLPFALLGSTNKDCPTLRLCSECENVLDWRELIIDGYILFLVLAR